jgi:DNA-directed RNA polymerase subunit RPC12/RpoP
MTEDARPLVLNFPCDNCGKEVSIPSNLATTRCSGCSQVVATPHAMEHGGFVQANRLVHYNRCKCGCLLQFDPGVVLAKCPQCKESNFVTPPQSNSKYYNCAYCSLPFVISLDEGNECDIKVTPFRIICPSPTCRKTMFNGYVPLWWLNVFSFLLLAILLVVLLFFTKSYMLLFDCFALFACFVYIVHLFYLCFCKRPIPLDTTLGPSSL